MAKRITEFTGATSLAEGDLFALVDVSDTTQATSGTTKKSALSLIADYLKARVETLTNKTLTSPKINEDVELTATSTELNKTEDIAGDIVGTTDTQTLTNKTLSTGSVVDANVNVVEILKKAYPVGSIYINASVSTNPATLLGFGTWSAFGAGRTLVGIDSGDTDFDTIGETGGAKTHTLQVSEIPSHRHTSVANDAGANTGDQLSYGGADANIQNYPTTYVGGGGSHNNLQPYIVTYLWKRLT